MSAVLRADAVTGQTGTYFYLWNSAGLVYNGSAMVAYNETDKDAYDIAATEAGTSGRYTAAFPAGLAAGVYEPKLYDSDGNGIATASLYWNGTEEAVEPQEGTALITLVDAKRYLKIAAATTGEDCIVTDFINECTEWINSYCGRRFIAPAAAITEYYDGDGTKTLFLRQWPVITLTSMAMDYTRTWGSDTAIDVSADVQVDSESGILTLWNGQSIYNVGVGNVRVVYRAGYVYESTVPYDLQMACRKLVAWKYFQDYSQRRFGVASESTGDRQVNYTDEALLPDVKQILDRYRRIF